MSRKKPPEPDAPDNLPDGDWSIVKALLSERLEQGRADRVEIQAKIVRGDLLLRDMFSFSLGSIYAAYRSTLLSMDASAGDMVGVFLAMPEAKPHIIRRIIGETAYNATGEIKTRMEKFIRESY